MTSEVQVVNEVYEEYEILEHKEFSYDCYKADIKTHPVAEHIENYCKRFPRDKRFFVSLSGGVDSMVIATVFNALGYDVTCIHINYNNRRESVCEANFIRTWCEKKGIPIVYENIKDYKRGEMNRNKYEEVTRKIRFDLYHKVAGTENEVILGHHDDDIIENVFSNFCKGRNILDLSVMTEHSVMFGVNIARPLLGLRKKSVYDFAHKFKVAYFKDTTPSWSVRGTFRNILFPLLEKTFSGFASNLLNVAVQSYQWNELFQKEILNPYLKTVTYNESSVVIPIVKYKNSGECLWKHILQIVFHNYHRAAPSAKSVRNFINSFDKTGTSLMLTNKAKIVCGEDKATLTFE